MSKLKRPKSSFADWLAQIPDDGFLEDINHLFGIGYCATEKGSPLTRKEQIKYAKLIAEKIDLRYHHYMERRWKWDGRHWRWYFKLLNLMKSRRNYGGSAKNTGSAPRRVQ